jgi:hypothetical protein
MDSTRKRILARITCITFIAPISEVRRRVGALQGHPGSGGELSLQLLTVARTHGGLASAII